MSARHTVAIAIMGLVCSCGGDSSDNHGHDAPSCVPSVEDCFNGLDDDCNGLTDCGDPACTGGADPVASCVPAAGAFTAGVLVDASASCPSEWPTSLVVHSGLDPQCDIGTCGCGGVTGACSTRIFNDGGTTTCPQATGVVVVNQSNCSAAFSIAAGSYHSTAPVWKGTCSATGAAGKTTSWTESQRFCSGATVGGGCTGGAVCVPRATNHCVIAEGSATCPQDYVPRATYYTDVDDTARTCSCKCDDGAGGTCAGTSVVTLFTGAACSGTSAALTNACSNSDVSTFTTASATGLTPVGGACGAETVESGAAVPMGEHTICCTQ